MHTCFRMFAQIFVFIVMSWIMNKLVLWLHIPVPGSILGMILVFLLLQMRVVPRSFLEAGSNRLISTMLLFFIPPAVGIVSYGQLLISKGLQIVLVIMLGTMIVMISSGLIAQGIAKWKETSQP
ncbi:CidA/LrgA family protein [Paenibacillus hexagrammi]|uniref:CidA/LrgA family holin-like protein n=1 Tax=Paenibacillus hexagrammi TaxID=2908839 RepID=A0ABY3SQ65_9BACL|nr:CidA/LrgA family holin-like protein [Paenibacillus sp. YPD9-1]UJF35690.1 CidA/LrgA family holin-like protein [Paenibacillus sp. YPD9-1]